MKFSIPTNRLIRFVLAATISGVAIAVAHSAFTSAQAPLPAFPGAAGFGANARGGRGGSVYIVTNLNDNGPGSFRDAVSQPNRYVVFAVGGVIRINSRIQVAPNLTIAGQTAPGEGVTIYGNGLSFSNANNTITRYLRVRMGVVGDSGVDAVTIAEGDNMIFDHVSVSWGRDETFSISGAPSNVTVQDSIIAQGLFSHSAGGLLQTSGGVSIVRCLYIDNTTRNPKVKGVNEFVNNVVYNWGSGGGYILGDSAGDSFVNVIENYYINGPSTTIQPFTRGNLNFHIYAQNNYHDDNLNGLLDGAVVPQSGYTTVDWVTTPFPYPTVGALSVMPAPEAYDHVIANAGASRVRDRVDLRLIEEAQSLGSLGEIISNENDPPMNGPGPVAGGRAPVDTDQDGMPDYWEIAAGLNPNVADHNGDADGNGYTNLEDYLNSLVEGGVQQGSITGVTDDTGLSASDAITSDDTLTLNGVARPGANVAVTQVGIGVIGSATADSNGRWSFDLGAPLGEGPHAFMATFADASGHVSPPTPALLVTVDRTPPSAPVISSVTLDPQLTINGTGEVGGQAEVTLEGVGSLGQALVNEDGLWSLSYTGAPLTPGQRTFTAVITDRAGNMGPASTPYVIDTSIAAPTITSVSDDTGASATDRITKDTTLILSGAAPVGTTVTVARAGAGTLGTTTVASDGSWIFDYTGTMLAPGVYNFSATATNPSGGSSPASAPFVVTVDTAAPAVISIQRQNPLTAATTASNLVFRGNFSESVSGVDLSDFALTLTGATTGSLSTLTPLSDRSFDVLVTGVGGEGTVRLDLKASGTGIMDVAGNVITSGFIAGQTYTIRASGSGVWITPETGGVWSDASNWQQDQIASGVSATADFASLDITEDVTVHLDSPRLLGNMVFGDTDVTTAANWLLDDNGSAPNVVNLVVNTGSPIITVNPLGGSAVATVGAVLNGSGGLTKAGTGTLVLTRANTIGGPLSVNQGTLRVGPGGSLSATTVTITNLVSSLNVAGGTFVASGLATITPRNSSIVIDSGEAHFDGGVTCTNTRDAIFSVRGGVVTASSVIFPRTSDATINFGSGLLIQGGTTTIGSVSLGTVNSWGVMSVEAGSLAIAGPLTVGHQVTSGRGGAFRVTGGELHVTDTEFGVVMSRNPGTNPNNVSQANFLGGVSMIEKFTLGFDSTVTAGSATITVNGGSLYLGAGGIAKNGAAGFATNLNFGGGLLGAKADWGTGLPINLSANGNIMIKAADVADVSHNITLTGSLSGAGGLTKLGGGRLALGGANTFTGAVAVNGGALDVDGSLGAGADLMVNSGGILTGDGTIGRAVVLNSNGAIMPGSAAFDSALTVDSLAWNPGGVLAFNLDSTTNHLAVTGALTKGEAGPRHFVFGSGQGFAVGNVYKLVTFGSTDLTASDLTYSGLPPGFIGAFTVTSNLGAGSIVFEVFGPPVIAAQPQSVTALMGGTATFSVAVNNSPGLGYQWFKDGVAIAGATGSSLTINNALATDIGSYTAVVNNGAGIATSDAATLSIAAVALVNHAPAFNGGVLEGSIRQLIGENVALNGGAMISGDLFAPGLPNVVLNGSANYGGTLDGEGAGTPTNYTVTLNNNTTLGHVVRRADPVPLPTVAAPAPPTGTRSVTLNNSSDPIGDWATLRNLMLNSNVGQIAALAGAYGDFTANGGSGFTLGVAGAVLPSVYYFQRLTLNSQARIEVVGPVIVIVANGISVNGGVIGNADHPAWLTFNVYAGGLTLNGGANVYGYVAAPRGAVAVNGNCLIVGGLASDRLTINNNGRLRLLAPSE
ncbi:MAG TPA: Ig-like domain-containing protein [Blastocatellia bacterium]|jgi:rhamnogalacturonan endolyase|nr:Ig-like domain-containing protein [Blastocatellia bacterium]